MPAAALLHAARPKMRRARKTLRIRAVSMPFANEHVLFSQALRQPTLSADDPLPGGDGSGAPLHHFGSLAAVLFRFHDQFDNVQ
jgi:hypothetical protein